MTRGLRSFLARYADDDRGNTAAIVAVCIVFLLGTAAMATDVGYVYFSKLKLQASADAAALAGATMIANGATTDPIVEATSFSAVAGDKNASNSYVATMASGYPKLICSGTLKTQHDPCLTTFPNAPPAGANAIQVVENATVPSFFAKVFGVSHFTVSATSTAAAQGGKPKPLDLEIILDTTNSMGQSDPNCGISGGTKIQCATAGLKALLLALDPSVQKVGLWTFPGFTSSGQANNDYTCGSKSPNITPYYSSPVYQVIALSSDYRMSDGATTLNPNSFLAIAAGAGGKCGTPIQTPGGQGTYYTQAINAAQADLVANAPTGTTRAIILLSDGEANAENGVASYTVTSGGSGYTNAPNVTVQVPDGNDNVIQATATATINASGQVNAITVKNIGGGYSFSPAPTVTIAAPPKKSGNATATAVANPTNPPGLQQCHAAATAGQAATAAGTLVYTVAYGSSNAISGSDSCTTDTSPTTTPCLTLQNIASELAYFFSDGSGGVTCANAQAVTNLAQAFTTIASSITSVRLIPDSWFAT